MVLPNSILIGAQKAGTSSFYNWLSQHPDICAPEFVKDYSFFSNDKYYTKGLDGLANYYETYAGEKIVLHGSVSYMYFNKKVIDRLLNFNPDLKLIAVLRNPVDRAFSAYNYCKKLYIESLDFKEALREEGKRKIGSFQEQAELTYVEHGLYFNQLQPFFSSFPKENIKIIIFEDLIRKENEIISEVFDFLGVDTAFKPLYKVKNLTGQTRHKWIHRLVYKDYYIRKILVQAFDFVIPIDARTKIKNKINAWNTKDGSDNLRIDQGLKVEMFNLFREDIENLEELLGIDLSIWKIHKQK